MIFDDDIYTNDIPFERLQGVQRYKPYQSVSLTRCERITSITLFLVTTSDDTHTNTLD